MYYVWAEGSCDDSTTSLDEAVDWANQFANDDYEDVYVVDDQNIIVYRACL